jgi:hypothetical protein
MTRRNIGGSAHLKKCGLAALTALTLAATAACSPSASVGHMPAVAPLTSELVLGVSTRDDVRRSLGDPSGDGQYLFIADYLPREAWLYHEIKLTDAKAVHDTVVMNMRHQVLLVFFKGDRYDGYMWYSNAGTAAAKPN